MAAPSSVSGKAPPTASTPDLSWFSCFCCSRRPIPEASFCMLLTTCSHIVCSSCWDPSRGPSGDCPACGVRANTLNLTTTRPTPKQLEPYFTNPVKLITNLLSACKFQEHQKRQGLARRKKAWVLINHFRAKEDYEKVYAECKKVLEEQNQKKKALRTVVEMLQRRGIDACAEQRAAFPESTWEAVLGSITPRNASGVPPSTPFFTTPLVGRPLSTSTPAVPQGTNQRGVEFSQPKKLPHTMRGSVTSLTVRRSPSNPQTPLSQLKKPLTPDGTPSIIPAKRQRMMTTPVVNPTPSKQLTTSAQRVSLGFQPMSGGRLQGHTPISVVHPSQQPGVYGSSQVLSSSGGRPTAPLGPTEMSAKMQSLTLRHRGGLSHQKPCSEQQFHRPMVQSGRPTPQSVRPTTGQPIRQYSYPNSQSRQPTPQSVRAIPHPATRSGRPTPQSSRPTWQMDTSHHSTSPQFAAHHQRASPGDSVSRVRAVPPSSTATSRRIFPSPAPSRNSQKSHGSSNAQPPRTRTPPTNTQSSSSRITIGPPPPLKPLSQAVNQFHSSWSQPRSSSASPGRVRAETPTNPSPLLTAFATPSPWQHGQRSQGSSPWQQANTGSRLSVGSVRRPRLTPVKT